MYASLLYKWVLTVLRLSTDPASGSINILLCCRLAPRQPTNVEIWVRGLTVRIGQNARGAIEGRC